MTASSLSRAAAAVAVMAAAFALGRWTAPAPIVAAPTLPAAGSSVAAPAAAADTAPSVLRFEFAIGLPSTLARPGSLAKEEERLDALKRWAETEPRAAMAFAREQLQGDRQAQAISAILTVWGRRDPAAAWAWVQAEAPEATHHFDTLLETFGRESGPIAARYAAEYAATHPGTALEVHLAALLGITYRGDFVGARALVDGNAALDPEARGTLQNFIAGQWARFAPQEAAAWVMSLPAGAQRDQALIGLGETWSEVNPAEATRFAATLAPGDTRALAMRQAIGKWVESNPRAARDWVLQSDSHTDYDQAVSAIATQTNFMSREPAQAIKWAECIFDDTVRMTSMTAILMNWYPADPAAATAYVQSSPDLTPAQKAAVLKQLHPTG